MRHLALILVFAACGDDTPRVAPPAARATAEREVADPARGMIAERYGAAPDFAEAVLAEQLGDDDSARAGFERVLADGSVPTLIAARSALHLAQLESRAGRLRKGLDLAVRAVALAPDDVAISEGYAQMRAEAVGRSSEGNSRGPRLGTTLVGVEPAVAKAFAAAERTNARVSKLRPRAVIELLSSSIDIKQKATERVASAYRAVADAGGVAQLAGRYRAGSMYHDLALALLFDLPSELDSGVATGLRRTLRARAQGYLRKAVVEYNAALAAPPLADGELWRLAAETDLRAAQDVLGGAGGRRL